MLFHVTNLIVWEGKRGKFCYVDEMATEGRVRAQFTKQQAYLTRMTILQENNASQGLQTIQSV